MQKMLFSGDDVWSVLSYHYMYNDRSVWGV